MPFDPTRPHNDLPALPPAVELESRAVLKACISARAVVAELKAVGRLIPNQGVLINTIPLLEAQASSEIENIVTTTDQMFLFDGVSEGNADPATKEALRYRTALWEGFQALKERPLSTNTAVQICRAIKGVDMDVRRTPGTTLSNAQTLEVIYTPPEGEALLREKLANWERWMHGALPGSEEIDPLVRMAVAHYQFEAIHPFTDGNGRTGRVINLLYLVEQELLDIPVLYLSRHILRNRAEYYRGLQSVTQDGAWEPWLLYMLQGVSDTARWTMNKIHAVRKLLDVTTERMRQEAPQVYSRELAELVFERPYCRIAHVTNAGLAKRQTASVYLKQLADIGILREHKVGREKIFVNPAFVDLLKQD
ncbi:MULTISPECIES: protein adenylyltransferase Fic [unclassified Roseateles]|uniref:protein adenylyltransferase Fic n=1 Tax=unclassified Roseateles TaxID=2626991 RepID=UPI0006FC7A09|nr:MULTISPECIES: Fic family protein [unclassified Roseateles]KQW46695.1 addiction module protein [Pelomonas sp. Root405]KRA73747.1 addiction module protein [Pelomonas sp. Root662]